MASKKISVAPQPGTGRLTPAGIALRYAAFAALWIIISGYLLTIAVEDPLLQSRIEIGKGLLFVAVTSALVFMLTRRLAAAGDARTIVAPDPSSIHSRRPLFVAFIVFLIAVAVAGLLVRQSEQQRSQEQRRRLADQTDDHTRIIQRDVERALSATYALAALVQQGNGNIRNFDVTARELLPYYPGAASLQLAPGGIVQQIFPLAGNEKAIGHNLLLDPTRDKEAFRARDSGQLTLAGPFTLIQGGMGAVGRLPVFMTDNKGEKSFWGFTSVLIRFPEALHDTRLDRLAEQGISYELWRINPDTRQKQVIAASPSAPTDPIARTFDMPNGTWTLSTAPIKGWGDPFGLMFKSAIGLMFSLLLGYLAKLLVELRSHKQQLEALVVQRTAEITASQNKLQATFDAIPDLVWLKDTESVYLDCNPMFERVVGTNKANIIGKNDYDFFDKTLADFFRAHDRKAIAADKPSSNEEWITFADGRRVLFEATKTPMRDADGKLVGVLGIARNITERKQAEESQRQSEQRFRDMSEAAGAYLWEIDVNMVYTYVSNQSINVKGYLPEELLGHTPMEFMPKDDIKPVGEIVSRAIANKSPFKLQHRDITKSGDVVWEEVHGATFYDQNGMVIGLRGTGLNITARKQAEEKLHLAASVFTHSREAIMITDLDGAILDVNDAFTRITGYSRDEVLGQNPRMLNSGRQEKEFYADMWHGLIEKGHWYGEVWNRRKNGEIYAEMQTISTVRDASGTPLRYVALFSDITSHKEHQKQLEHIAHYDALTSLPNRVLLADRLHQGMAQSQRRGQLLAVVYLDLDGFKTINDNHGHEIGDQLLISLADRMKQALREGDTLARLGGDEFVAVLSDLTDTAASVPMLTRLLAAAAQPVHIDDLRLQVSASLGISFYPQTDDVDADQLLRQADQAMYQAKLAGKNRYHVFDAEQDNNIRFHHESQEHIRRALVAHEFVLYYQPKVNMRTGKVVGAEALIRWQHPERGLLAPAMFLPVIEDNPLTVEIGEWVIDAALTQMELWHAAGLDIPVSVNVGARQLQQSDFVDRLRALLAAHPNIRPGDLELEVLETSALEDLAKVSKVIETCRGIGVGFALDDFGTGYSSLTYLKRLPVKLLKIDQSFVRDMLDDPDDMAILEGVIGLAAAFRRQVIAEGVETVEHGEMLLQLGCELAQGYGIARPMPASEMPVWSAAWRTDLAWVDLNPVSRDDLPLLFAGAEHRAWFTAMEQHIKGERDVPPLLHHSQCSFGMWLEAGGRTRYSSQPAFLPIEALHRQLHDMAMEVCEFHAQGGNLEALKRLDELHGLQNGLLAQLKALRQEIQH